MSDALLSPTASPAALSNHGDAAHALWNRAAVLVVAAVWFGMLVSDLVLVRDYGRNIPCWEDWEFVPPLTIEKVDLPWLFAQHVEHRLPLPRLILVVLFRSTGLDFRSGLYFNVFGLALTALALIAAARHIRGRTSFADAAFPLLLMNWGHWNNLLWNWQVQFITSTLLTTAVLLLILWSNQRLSVARASLLGVCLLLLPMCGANGLALAPLPALWLCWLGVRSFRDVPPHRLAGSIAIVLAVATLATTVSYWVGLRAPEEINRRNGLLPAAMTFVAFIGQGFGRPDWSGVIAREALLPIIAVLGTRLWLRRPLHGRDYLVIALSVLLLRGLQFQCEAMHLPLPLPSKRTAWGLLGMAAVGLCVILLIGEGWRHSEERSRSIGLLSYLGGLTVLALGIGWGRAGTLSDTYDTPRYYTLAVAWPCAVALILEAYAGRRVLLFARPLLVCVALAMVWGNTPAGRALAARRLEGIESFRHDLHSGLSAAEVMRRHASNAFVFVRPLLNNHYERCLLMLRDARHPEFRDVTGAMPAPSRDEP